MDDFHGDPLNHIAAALGESPARTQTALGAALPALLGALATKASAASGVSDLLDLIRRNKLDARQFTETSAATATAANVKELMSSGRPVLEYALGGRTNSVTDWISSFAGIARSSATSLLTLAAPLLIGRIGRIAGSGGLNATNLQNVLAEQRAYLQDVPAGL